jgi:TolB protein
MKLFHHLMLSVTLLAGSAAHAQLRVEIAGVGSTQIPVAVATFADEGIAPAEVSRVIRADLERSGVFKVIDAGMVIGENAPVDTAAWKGRGASALVIGTVARSADGRLEFRYRLLDTVKGGNLSARSWTDFATNTRFTAHRIADDVYEKLTGVRGAFATRIAYVKENRAAKDYRLEVADSDGENVQMAFKSHESIISPAWSPDGTKVAYVTFEKNKPIIMLQDLVSGTRRIIVNEKGSNSGPAWSPDGQKLAITLSKPGHTQIYSINLNGSGLTRLTNSPPSVVDLEPRYSPDGSTIYFTSDRSGGPQIYKMSANGGAAQRVTFQGSYNISPRISPDGKTLAYISQRNGFALYVMNLATGQELRLADNASEPSFSPNGKYIMYATKEGGRTTLGIVSVDGGVKQRLTTQLGNIREPSWGPYFK